MKNGWTSYTRRGLAVGFALGLLMGVGMLVGAWVTMWMQPAVSSSFAFPETALHASATDSGDTFAIATGLVSDGIEGVFFLDFLSGDMQCWVINGRTGQTGGYFVQNVVADLGVEVGRKNPRYLMVTGQAPMSRGTSAMRPADSLVYVADANSGNFAVYALPWNRQATASNRAQQAPMALIFKGSARNLEIRGQ
ncbi:MAG: hypothetical protein ACYC6N_02895 [Pirellulaceae bacterium]